MTGVQTRALPISRKADLHFVLGNAFFAQGRKAEARGAFENTVKLEPTRASAHYNLAVVGCEMGDRTTASREAAEALRLDPSHARARDLLRELRAPRDRERGEKKKFQSESGNVF